jgi:hypothetical protein
MPRMLFRIAVVTLALAACTEVTHPPDGGAGGTGGSANTGGSGGAGGQGGAGGVDPCSTVVPEPTEDTEENDVVEGGIAIGSVSGACPGGVCAGDDPFDRWAITTCGGQHSIQLRWDEVANDLDLYLFDSDGMQIAQSATPDTTSETIVTDLQTDEQYTIEVQAFDTNGIAQTYNLEIVPIGRD